MPISQSLVRRLKSGTLLLGVAFTTATVLWQPGPSLAQPTSAPAVTGSAAPRGLPDFADLAEQVGPSVVNIRTTEKVVPGQAGSQEEQMLEFFRRFGLPVPPGASPRGPRSQSSPVPTRRASSPTIRTSTKAHLQPIISHRRKATLAEQAQVRRCSLPWARKA